MITGSNSRGFAVRELGTKILPTNTSALTVPTHNWRQGVCVFMCVCVCVCVHVCVCVCVCVR